MIARPHLSLLLFCAYLLLQLLLPLAELSAAPIISEFSAAGQGQVIDDDDDYPDWLEVHNPDAEPYVLTDHYVTDDPGNLTKWTFPRGQTLRPGEHLLLYASRKDRTNIFQAAIHTNFSLATSGGFIALVASDGETVLHQWADYPKQRVGVSYGLGSGGQPGYFDQATPGAANLQAIPEVVKDTKFSVDRGFHTDPVSLTITSATEGARIHFTLDGSEPGLEHGTLFESPITIDETTVVRAIAMKEGMISSNIDTHSYLFLSSVLNQPEDPAGFPNRWGSVPSDYEFDTSVGTTEEFEAALLGYPSISLVMPIDSWFNPSRQDGEGGIYANSLERGADWEKAVSAEFINFEGSRDTQVDCGIRIYGNASRQTSRPKHNMRLAFRSRYGPSKLDFPVFGRDQATGINGLLFNGQNGDSWFHPNLGQRQTASYLRDHFAHELLGDMGHLTPPQSRAHLYINGLYWGFYQTVERVDHHFMARLLGGEPEEYDSMKASIQEGPTVVAGNSRAYDAMFDVANAGVSDAAGYAAIQQYLDLDSFIDYMLINFWSGNRDWDHNNWRNGRHRSEGSPWHYFMWDSENIFKESGIDRTGNNTANNPTRLHSQLSRNADYRLKFADHVQKHLFNNGLLTEETVKARWQRWADYIRPGLKAESARWGDHHRRGNPHTVEDDFERAFVDLMENMFPQRAKNALRQFKNRDLYPTDLQPVEFNQHGGPIDSGFTFTMKAGTIFQPQDGDILFTLDQTDPMEGGTVYAEAIALTETTTVKARVRDESGRWGPVNVARFTLGQRPQVGELFISEIHYHPAEPTAEENPDGVWSRTDFEFVEIANVSPRTLQLGGIAFTAGIRFTFPEHSLAPGQRLLVVEDATAFEQRYGTTPADRIAGIYRGQLNNGGEQLTLSDDVGQTLHTLFFDDEEAWPAEADGQGQSLVLSNPDAASDAEGWSLSQSIGGSPGSADGDTGSKPPNNLLDGLSPGGVQVTPTLLSISLLEEASAWLVMPQGSDDLHTWRETGIGLERIEGGEARLRQWKISEDGRKPFYRFRISLP